MTLGGSSALVIHHFQSMHMDQPEAPLSLWVVTKEIMGGCNLIDRGAPGRNRTYIFSLGRNYSIH